MPRTVPAPLTCALLVLVLAGACRVSRVEPTPLLGPMPRSIVVWPVLAEPYRSQPEVFAGLDLAMRMRGYDVRSLAVGQQLLAEAGLLEDPFDAARIGVVLGVDAVLRLDVREFTMVADRGLQSARWHLGWQLVSTRGGGVLWSFSHQGSWSRRDLDTGDPLRRYDDEPGFVPIGGSAVPNFHDAVEVAAWLHRHAMDHLPKHEG